MRRASYAKHTTVSVAKTRLEIEALLARHDCQATATAVAPGRAVVVFEKAHRRVRFQMPLSAAKGSSPKEAKRVESEQRAQWRALLLALKSKFVSVETGIESFEEAFLAHVVLPSNQRVGDVLLPQLADTYASGSMPPFLLGAGGDSA